MSEPPTVAGLESQLAVVSARAAELEQRLLDQGTAATTRLLQAELKAAAVAAGMIDLDGIKLIDLKQVVSSVDGTALGLDEVMSDFRRQKPWLFGTATSSSTAAAPSSSPPIRKQATDMTLDEWRMARAELLRRR